MPAAIHMPNGIRIKQLDEINNNHINDKDPDHMALRPDDSD